MSSEHPTGALVIRQGDDGQPFYEAKWRREGRQVKRRVGPAWLDPAPAGGWQPRPGRVPSGWFDEKRAIVRMAELVAAHDAAESAIEERERERKLRGATLRELAAEWLDYLKREKGAKPSTLLDYGYMLKDPGTRHRRGGRQSAGRIMQAFGDARLRDVTTSQVAAFLRGLDRSGISPRSVNKHRQVLAAMFSYACREDTYALPANPVKGTSKRREMPAAVLDFYEPEETEALARAAACGAHRGTPRLRDRRRRARVARLGGSPGRRALPRRGLHRDATRRAARAALGGRRPRRPPRDRPPRRQRQRRRAHEELAGTSPAARRPRGRGTRPAGRPWRLHRPANDYVFCSRLGRRLDPSAVRRRYKSARDAAGLRPLRFHALRHAAGSLVAREAGAHFVQAFLGHSRLSTTERYLHAKSRPQDVEVLNKAFAGANGPASLPAEKR